MNTYELTETPGSVPIKSWTKGVVFEESARAQVANTATMPFVHSHVAIMPDVHMGIGATVGSVVATINAIIPASCGVDIGCVDKDTEFLSPNGWRKISEYSDELVMQYNCESGLGEFVKPSAFIKLPCSEFYYIHTKYGVNQMLSAEHKVLYAKYDRGYNFDKLGTISAKELAEKHGSLTLGFRGRFITSFLATKDPLRGCVTGGEAKLRVMVMVMADGHFPNPNTNNCVLVFKKTRKIQRAQDLLNKAGIEFVLNETKKITTIRFMAPYHEKTMTWLWYADPSELQVICDEVFYWDGNFKERCFYTRIKDSADFMSYAFSACGYRAVMRMDLKDGVPDYRVFAQTNTKVGINGTPKSPIALVPSQDGFKYCFTLPSGFWVMRRNGVVAMTGNCGMNAVRTSLKASDLPTSLVKMREMIERAVPCGRTNNGGAGDRGAWTNVPSSVLSVWHGMNTDYEKILAKHPMIVRANKTDVRGISQLGTLGSGNHFIEVCLDELDRVWVVLHSGSRGIGNAIGSYFIQRAKDEMVKNHVHLVDKDLSYLAQGGPHFNDYVEAVEWAQNYALKNREVMMGRVLDAVSKTHGVPAFQARVEAVSCHHNYVSREHHFGQEVFVTRKGAVRASKDMMGIIPGCFGAGTRVLMSNGTYKNIEDIQLGDRVISGTGRTVNVLSGFSRGVRQVWNYKNNISHVRTTVTPDHKHFVGDLTTKTYQRSGCVKILSTKLNGETRYRWQRVNEFSNSVTMLTPRKIEFADMQTSFSKVFGEITLNPSYSLGYMFGTFLGDGTSYYRKSDGGQVTYAFGLSEENIATKTQTCLFNAFGLAAKIYKTKNTILVVVHSASLAQLFNVFGKREMKAIPPEFWCNQREYIQGIYDGLIDSDGHVGAGTKKLTNTGKQCVEQFGVIHHLLFGYFPSISIRKASVGGLTDCKIENCKTSFRASSLKKPQLTDNFQCVPINNLDKTELFAEVFDIEVDDNEHSFLANNVIVHNSMGARTYIVRGLGNPDSFESCSHGAGRVMSRTQARKTISVADHVLATTGIECRKDEDVVDESPACYKNIDHVMEAQKDLCVPVHTLHQVLCVKG